MDREILMASFQKIRELALYLDSARWRQPRGLGVWAIDALQCDSNQSDEGAGVGRDEQRVAWQNKASQSDSCTIIYSSSLTLTHDQPLIGIHNSLPNEDVNFATVAASQDALWHPTWLLLKNTDYIVVPLRKKVHRIQSSYIYWEGIVTLFLHIGSAINLLSVTTQRYVNKENGYTKSKNRVFHWEKCILKWVDVIDVQVE